MTFTDADEQLVRPTHGEPVLGVFSSYIEHIVREWRMQSAKLAYEDLKESCCLPIDIWNATVLNDYYPLAFESNALSDIYDIFPGEVNKSKINFWANRKRRKFGKYKYLFSYFNFYECVDGGMLVSANHFIPKEVVKVYGRYGEYSVN